MQNRSDINRRCAVTISAAERLLRPLYLLHGSTMAAEHVLDRPIDFRRKAIMRMSVKLIATAPTGDDLDPEMMKNRAAVRTSVVT
jgi:hypothetical protein